MIIQSTVFTADEHQDATLFCDAVSQSAVSYVWIVNQPGVNMAVLLPGQTLDNLRGKVEVCFLTFYLYYNANDVHL